MPPPSLVLAGAPKCGTSSLYRWLAEHPGACGARRKETFYLVDPDSPFRRAGANFHDRGVAGYLQLFDHCPAGHVTLEATSHYLYQGCASTVLGTLDPPPVIVVVLRRPSLRILSSFRFSAYRLGSVDRGLSFAQYVDALLQGDVAAIAGRCRTDTSAYVLPRELEYSRYAEHLERWADDLLVGKLRLLVFEQMIADPAPVVRRLALDLGIEADWYAGYDFETHNPTRTLRRPRLHRRLAPLRRAVGDGTLAAFARRVYLRLQTRRPPPLTPADRRALERLDDHFAPYNQRLASGFGLDLSPWDGPAP